MQELEKILEEIDIKITQSMWRKREGLFEAENIIRKHMNENKGNKLVVDDIEVVSEKEEKETKEVTNRMLLEHLKEIEIAQGCIANGINTLFNVMKARKEQLKLSSEEATVIQVKQFALRCLIDRMADISGMKEKVQNNKEEAQKSAKEAAEIFLDFLEEILS